MAIDSNVVIVSKAAYEHEWVPEGRTLRGTVFTDEAYELHAGLTREQLRDGAVQSPDWRGASADLQPDEPVKRGPGRPRK